jgi:hypothetical protein
MFLYLFLSLLIIWFCLQYLENSGSSTWHFVFHAWTRLSLTWIGNGGQEVRTTCRGSRFQPIFWKYFDGTVTRAVEDCMALIKEDDFVKEVIHRLGGLIGGHCMTRFAYIGRERKVLDELQRKGCIESAGAIVLSIQLFKSLTWLS